MAEIKIEKKSPIWPWVLVIIVVIAIIAYFVYNNDNNSAYDDDMNSEEMDTISNTYEGYQSTTPYMDSTSVVEQFKNATIDSSRIGVDSTYTKTAILHLTKVVTMKAEENNLQSSAALQNLKQYSNQMDAMTNSDSPEHSDVYKNFKTVSNDIVAVLETIQAKSYPSLQDEVSELKQASNKIDDNVAIKEQQNTIQTFFAKAREVVNDMNT